ncbi:MAG: hypothetical protein FJ191_13760 [Gammaproteobacteria bacterium]|nr:hypothetical protein [Gammaproteobacteria bacterium]
MSKQIRTAILALMLSAGGAGPAAVAAEAGAEIAALQAQIAALLQRVEELERTVAGTAVLHERITAVEATNERQTDQLAQGLAATTAMGWARNVRWKGDLRYRHEQFEVEGVTSDRVRQRIRARLGLEAKLSDTLAAGFQIATGEPGNPRSSNATLDDANLGKQILLDLAYVDWRPRPGLLVTAGKQKQPWFRAGTSMFFDSDVNPEGVAVQYGGRSGPFARAWGFWLDERAAAADTNLLGGQLGYAFGSGVTVAAGYWDYGAVADRQILGYSGAPAGNSTYDCGTQRCYRHDYDVAVLDAQWSGQLGGRPLTLFGGYLENLAVSHDGSGYDLGLVVGRAGDPGSWEAGLLWQQVEADAQFGALYESDFADGLTQGRGFVLHGVWVPAKNVNLRATYFVNERSYDRPAEADYRRLQFDLNLKF